MWWHVCRISKRSKANEPAIERGRGEDVGQDNDGSDSYIDDGMQNNTNMRRPTQTNQMELFVVFVCCFVSKTLIIIEIQFFESKEEEEQHREKENNRSVINRLVNIYIYIVLCKCSFRTSHSPTHITHAHIFQPNIIRNECV